MCSNRPFIHTLFCYVCLLVVVVVGGGGGALLVCLQVLFFSVKGWNTFQMQSFILNVNASSFWLHLNFLEASAPFARPFDLFQIRRQQIWQMRNMFHDINYQFI